MDNIIRLSVKEKVNILEQNNIEYDTRDKEQWLKDNPMDYVKAVKILNSFPVEVRHEVFRQIFSITRLFLPETLYKFYSITEDKALNEKKLKTLNEHKVYLSELTKLNDPFDGRAIFYNAEELMQFNVLKRHDGMLIDDFASFHIGTSLSSADFRSMPMWAHYSNNHLGYCTSYKTSNNPNLRTFGFPVQYLDARIDITEYMVEFTEYFLNEKRKQSVRGNKVIILSDFKLIYMMQLLENIKGIDWAYEKEFKVMLPKNHPNPYMELHPNQIYIGKNCNDDVVNTLLNIGKEQNIEVYKMRQGTASTRFEIHPNLIYSP